LPEESARFPSGRESSRQKSKKKKKTPPKKKKPTHQKHTPQKENKKKIGKRCSSTSCGAGTHGLPSATGRAIVEKLRLPTFSVGEGRECISSALGEKISIFGMKEEKGKKCLDQPSLISDLEGGGSVPHKSGGSANRGGEGGGAEFRREFP